MILNSILNFTLEIVPNLLLNNLFKTLAAYLSRIFHNQPATLDDLDEEDDSEMGDNIWFDGVDKRLIEAHSKKVEMVKGDDASLLTNKPLISYRGIIKRRKLAQANQRNGSSHKSSDTKPTTTNGDASTSTSAKVNGRKAKTKTNGSTTNGTTTLDVSKYMLQPGSNLTEEVALDCEMVECYGNKSVLARISIVNLFGRVLLDTHVAPPAQVTDYRTRYSGIRAKDLANAPSFETVQAQVARLIKDRIVVGHAVHNDFAVLMLHHPTDKIRDTSPYYGQHYGLGKTPSLKRLCNTILGVKIQTGEHDSVQDAQATMKLYVRAREKWNEGVLKGKQNNKPAKGKKQKTKPQKKKVKAFFVETL